ncbi:hypothetical protein TP34_003012 [Salmonella enterica subsp. enterica serovar Perth]|nr:hypothetical protein [Salmonella enterica subsp. enterica serovar Perth]ECH8539878.1 hypothetical protein [Salmonella enterica subsp. enterica]ECI3769753.1 hypothetical protein [Salmonella enterica subsp. enterica]EDW4853708.1 hypothetical protein [Salmonella enterica subsp. enterica]EGI5338848.1 hypothetical protein [Salmonella enterica subsp. enterica serovar Perth]
MKTFIQKGNPALNQAELFKYQPHDTDNEWMAKLGPGLSSFCKCVVKITDIKQKRHVKTWRFQVKTRL